MSKKIIRLHDFPWIIAIFLLTLVGIIVCFTKQSFEIKWWHYCLLWWPDTLAIFLYSYFIVFRRWKALSSITFTTSHGLNVVCGEYIDQVSKDKVEKIVSDTLDLWKTKVNISPKDPLKDWTLAWQPKPFDAPNGKVNGITSAKYFLIEVGFTEPLESTALSHEIGHVLHADFAGFWNESIEHEFIKTHGLP
jgi:hypothetical protein